MALGTKRIDQLTPASSFLPGDLGYILRGSSTDLGMDMPAAIAAEIADAVEKAKEAYAYDGLILAYVSTTSFSVGAGVVGDGTHDQGMRIASTITKTTSAWAVGTAAGGLDTGTIALSTWYYVYLIKRVDTGVVDVLFSTSPTAPTMPANYTLKRLIGAVKTNASSQFIQWIMYSDGTQAWLASTADVADATLTTAKKNYTLLSVPPIVCMAHMYLFMANSTANTYIEIYGNTNITDAAPNLSPPNVVMTTGNAATSSSNSVTPFIFLSGSMHARSNNASTTLNATARDFNIRPFH